jgi:hypothetical protein
VRQNRGLGDVGGLQFRLATESRRDIEMDGDLSAQLTVSH